MRDEPHHGRDYVTRNASMSTATRTSTMSSTLRSRSYGSVVKESMTSSSREAITVDHENALNVSVPRLKEWSELRECNRDHGAEAEADELDRSGLAAVC